MDIKNQTSDLFVGRDEELRKFENWLDDPESQPVRLYCADGGMGKTWLLKACKQQLCCSHYENLLIVPGKENNDTVFENIDVIDLAGTQFRTVAGLQRELVKLIGEEKFPRFQKALAIFTDETGQSINVREALYERIQVSFIDDLKSLCAEQRIVLFCDTFERVYWEEVGYWLTYVLPQEVPGLRIVLASRPIANIESRTIKFVDVIELQEFSTENDVYHFFKTRGAVGQLLSGCNNQLPSHDILQSIVRQFGGVPLRLELAALLLTKGLADPKDLLAMKPDEIESELISYLRQLTNPITFEIQSVSYSIFDLILKMAYLNRRFDAQFVASIYDISIEAAGCVLQAFFENFPYRQSYFVKRIGNRFQLHDEMQAMVNKYGWELQFQNPVNVQEERQRLADMAIQLYQDLIQKFRKDHDLECAELETEQLDYILRLDPCEGFKKFRELFDEYLKQFQFGGCSMLAAEIRPYVDRGIYDDESAFEIRTRFATLSFRLGNLQTSFKEWQQTLELARTPEQRIKVLYGLHNSTWRTDTPQALDYLHQAWKIAKKNSLSLNFLGRIQQLLGFTYTQIGETQEAIKCYTRCINIARKMIDQSEEYKNFYEEAASLYAEAQNSRGYCYALLGDFKKAEAQVWDALTLRQRKNWQGEVGRSYSTRGAIARMQGDFRVANDFCNEAVRIFKQINDQEWLALVLQTRGANACQLSDKFRKHGERQRADEWLDLAYQGLKESYEKYEYYNLTRGRSQMLRRFGRVLRNRGEYEYAEEILNESLSLSCKNNNSIEQAKTLMELARVAAQSGKVKQMDDYLQQLEGVAADTPSFAVFKGLSHMVQGENYYRQQQWEKAFIAISTGLVELGHAGRLALPYFFSYHDQLQIQLDGLPNESLKRKWCDRLIQIWKHEKLDSSLPEVVHLCEGYKQSLAFLGDLM